MFSPFLEGPLPGTSAKDTNFSLSCLYVRFIISKWNSGLQHVAYGRVLLTQGLHCHPVCSCLFLLHVMFNIVGSLGGLWFLCLFV